MNQLKYQFRYALPVWFSMLITSWLPDNRISIKLRGFLVALFLPNRPKNFTIGRDVTLLGIDKLNIGNNVYFAKGTWINALGGVTIEDEIMFGPYVVLVSTKHTMKHNSVYQGSSDFEKVFIGKGTWIASHCTIASGVNIGCGCIVAANSVVSKDIRNYTLAGGIPAKEIKGLNE
ncbi:MAG: acyltransferase [Campylobacterota bacterium]